MGATRWFVFSRGWHLENEKCRPCICLLWGCPSCPEDVPWLSLLISTLGVSTSTFQWFKDVLKSFKILFTGLNTACRHFLQSNQLARTSQASKHGPFYM